MEENRKRMEREAKIILDDLVVVCIRDISTPTGSRSEIGKMAENVIHQLLYHTVPYCTILSLTECIGIQVLLVP